MSNFYITTAIPYVNDKPHLGHAVLHLYADVLARYMRQHKTPTLFSAGTDEHGGKIAEKAKDAGVEPQLFADQVSQSFRAMLKSLNISNDRFIRTTDPGHLQRSQVIWQKLAPYIYKNNYTGWYCTGHEEYFPEKVVQANKGICPDHNRPYEQLTEENYFFKLSAFAMPIRQAIETDNLRVVPTTRKNEILSLIKKGLEDISISRPASKINWGIPVPGDDSQVMYVWFEALLNYITVLGYPEHEDFKRFWPANVQVIGKDILRFHTAIWPGILLGLGLELPKTVFAHGFVEVGGKKMGKSLGNMVDPLELVQKYGVDAFRYYFLRYGPCLHDVDFNLDRFDEVYNSELADQLGNAVSRTAAMVSKYLQGTIGKMPESEHDIGAYEQAISDCRFDLAMEEVWEQVKGLNQYIDETKPWAIAKAQDATHLNEVLAYSASALLEVADMLVPFLPDTAAKIQATFGEGILRPLPGPLFPKAQPKAA